MVGGNWILRAELETATKAKQLTYTGILLLGLLSGFAPTALGCSTNPCDKEKVAPDFDDRQVNYSGRKCHEIVLDPIEAIAGCDSGNCSDAKLLPENPVLGEKTDARAIDLYYAECSGSQCRQEDQGQQAWHVG